MNQQMTSIPVITFDGPSGCGKGTISSKVARKLDWHFLDSGVLYRILALHFIERELEYDAAEIYAVTESLKIEFEYQDLIEGYVACLNGVEVEHKIRTNEVSQMASKLAEKPEVRAALVECQRRFKTMPGLVTDGRDMGTVIFPDASIKFYLTADIEQRVQRRYKQLKELGLDVNLATLKNEMVERDARDTTRSKAPLKAADDAIVVETTHLTIKQVFETVLSLISDKTLGIHKQ